MKCQDCDFKAKNPAGLALHRKAKHPGKVGNIEALEETLKELKRMGRLEKVDEATVQAVRGIAKALDENPHNAQLWREYRETLSMLKAEKDDDKDVVESLLAGLGPKK